MPFAEQIFAALDVNVYSLFVPTLLPKIKIPSIVLFNPQTQQFFTLNQKINSNNLQQIVETMIEKYNRNALPEYPFKHHYFKYCILIVVICFVVYFIKRSFLKQKLKLIQH